MFVLHWPQVVENCYDIQQEFNDHSILLFYSLIKPLDFPSHAQEQKDEAAEWNSSLTFLFIPGVECSTL